MKTNKKNTSPLPTTHTLDHEVAKYFIRHFLSTLSPIHALHLLSEVDLDLQIAVVSLGFPDISIETVAETEKQESITRFQFGEYRASSINGVPLSFSQLLRLVSLLAMKHRDDGTMSLLAPDIGKMPN